MAFLETFEFNRGRRSILSLAAFNAFINAYYDHLAAHRGCNFQRSSITSVRHHAMVVDASTAAWHQLHYLSSCHCYYSYYFHSGLSFADFASSLAASSATFGSEHVASFCYYYCNSHSS